MAVDMFLEIDGVEGESNDKSFPNQIEVESFSWGATQTTGKYRSAGGGGGGAGKVSVHDISIMKRLDKSTPELFLACASGEHIKKAVLTVRKAGEDSTGLNSPEYFLKIKMSDCLVSSFQVQGTNEFGPGPTTDQVSLNFAKIEYEYVQPLPDGSSSSVTAGWDVGANKKI